MSIRVFAMRSAVVAAWVLILATLVPPRATAAPLPVEEPAAILAVSSGAVTVIRGDQKIPGSFGFALEAGDVIDAGKDSQAAVLFESGQVIELGPGSRITVGSLPVRAVGSLVAEVSDAFSGSLGKFSQPSSDAGGLAALPQLRGGGPGDEPQLIAPRNTLVLPGVAAFRFTPVEGALEYAVTLTGPGRASGRHRVPAADAAVLVWTPPAGTAFQPGEAWTWMVEAATPDGAVRSEAAPFEVASAEAGRELDDLVRRLEPLIADGGDLRGDAALYLIGSYCRNTGFYCYAIERLEELAARNPGRKELRRELGVLYQAVGRNDMAAEAYRQAFGD